VVEENTAFARAFAERIQSAKKKGELPKEVDSEVAAQVLFTYLQGLFRVIRVLQHRDELERQIETLLRGLGL
jgi:hypothetical protein